MHLSCRCGFAGRPGTGKAIREAITAQAMMFELVQRAYPALMFSLERKATDLLRRTCFMAGSIPMSEIMSDRLSWESRDKLREVDAVLDEAGGTASGLARLAG